MAYGDPDYVEDVKVVELQELNLKRYGIKAMVNVRMDGVFQASVNGVGFAGNTLDNLESQIRMYAYTARADVPFVHAETGLRGVIRGVHKTQRTMLVTWADGDKGTIAPHARVLPGDTSAEVIAEIQEAQEALEGAKKRYKDAQAAEGNASAEELFEASLGESFLGWKAPTIEQVEAGEVPA